MRVGCSQVSDSQLDLIPFGWTEQTELAIGRPTILLAVKSKESTAAKLANTQSATEIVIDLLRRTLDLDASEAKNKQNSYLACSFICPSDLIVARSIGSSRDTETH